MDTSFAVIGHNTGMMEKCRLRRIGMVWINSKVWEHGCGLLRCTVPAFLRVEAKWGVGGGYDAKMPSMGKKVQP